MTVIKASFEFIEMRLSTDRVVLVQSSLHHKQFGKAKARGTEQRRYRNWHALQSNGGGVALFIRCTFLDGVSRRQKRAFVV